MTTAAVDALRADHEALAVIAGTLSAEEWVAPSACDGWAVRDVLGHMTQLFRQVVGSGRAPPADPSGSTERTQDRWVEALRGPPVEQVLADYRSPRRAGDRRSRWPPGQRHADGPGRPRHPSAAPDRQRLLLRPLHPHPGRPPGPARARSTAPRRPPTSATSPPPPTGSSPGSRRCRRGRRPPRPPRRSPGPAAAPPASGPTASPPPPSPRRSPTSSSGARAGGPGETSTSTSRGDVAAGTPFCDAVHVF